MSFLSTVRMPKFEFTDSPWNDVTIEDFSGGLCTNFPESVLLENQFRVLMNYYIEDNGSLKVRGPYRPWLVASEDTVLPNSAPPLSFIYVTLGTSDYIIASWDNGPNYEVSYYDETNDRWSGEGGGTSIKTDLTQAYSVEFVKFSVNDQEDLIFCNGVDTPQRWTGSGASSDLGLTAPSAPSSFSTDGNKGRGVATSGTYYYKLTNWYESDTTTAYGESNASSAGSTEITVTTDRFGVITVESITVDTASGVNRVYIYRSPVDNTDGPYRRVGYIATNNGDFTDNIPEGEEGAALPLANSAVPKLKHPLFAKGRLWGVGLDSSGNLTNKLVYSALRQADVFPALNYFYFPNEYIGSVEFNENIYHFTSKAIYITPNGDILSFPEPIKIAEKGCTSYQSIVDVGNGLVFQGEDNIYWVDFNTHSLKDGDFPIPIGEPVQDKIQSITSTYRSNSRACLHKGKYYLSYTSTGQTTNTATLVWNVRKGTILLHQGIMGGWTEVDWKANHLQDFKGTLYTSDNTNKYIMEHEWAGVVDYINKTEYDLTTSYNIVTELKTKRYHFGDEWSEKIIRSLSIVTETSGITYNTSLSLNYKDFERTRSFELGTATPSYSTDWLIWGQGLWGSSYWASSTYQIYSSHKGFGSGAKGKNAQLSIDSSNSKDTNLILLKLYYKTLPKVA